MGEKLKPLGLGDTGGNYDGQAPQRPQGQDDSKIVEGGHATQDGSAQKARNVEDEENAEQANQEAADRNYDLYIQVQTLVKMFKPAHCSAAHE